jgi:hypothetical protein
MAVAGTFNALVTELDDRLLITDARVQAALLNASVIIAMASDTRDMGLIGSPPRLSTNEDMISADSYVGQEDY